MKKALLLIVLGLNACTAPDPGTFTEDSFREFMKRFEASPVEILQKEAEPDFEFVTGDGRTFNLQELIEVYNIYRETEREYIDLRVRDLGSGAVASGNMVHNLVNKNTGDSMTSKLYFTYVFIKKNGLWKPVRGHHTDHIIPLNEARPVEL